MSDAPDAATPLDEALALARAGHPVLPLWGVTPVGGGTGACHCRVPDCPSPGKHPIGALVPHGLSDASLDPDTIRGWFTRDPTANVGVRCDGMAVLDVDLRRGGGQTYAWLEGLEDGPLSRTRRIDTGNGWHEWYRLDDADGVKAGGELAEGIDYKVGPTAYVVGPGSLHASGRRYTVSDNAQMAPVHPSVRARIARGAGTPGTSGVTTTEAYKVERVSEGGRNDFLKSTAGFLRNLAQSEDEMFLLLSAVNNERCVPPYEEHRIREFAKWAMTREGGTSLSPELLAPSSDAVERLRQRIWGVDRLRDQPLPAWDIDGLLLEKSVAVLYGEGGTCKSFLALDWALCRATGETWHGHAVRPGKALYIAAEGVGSYGARVGAWLAGRGGRWEDLEERFRVFPRAINLLTNPEEGAALVEVLREDGYDYLIVDTLRKAMSGGNENDTRDVGRVYEVLERARHEAGVGALIIHHANKGGVGSPSKFRGSTMIHDDADAVFRLTRDATKLRVILSCEKQKDVEEFDNLVLDLSPKNNSLYISAAGPLVPPAPPPKSTGRN